SLGRGAAFWSAQNQLSSAEDRTRFRWSPRPVVTINKQHSFLIANGFLFSCTSVHHHIISAASVSTTNDHYNPLALKRHFALNLTTMAFTASDICKIILAIILPPLGVFLERGCGADLLINVLLTIL
ncbi:hypothetical protein DH86_00001884, partial [Scytalidium sp. 3C]